MKLSDYTGEVSVEIVSKSTGRLGIDKYFIRDGELSYLDDLDRKIGKVYGTSRKYNIK